MKVDTMWRCVGVACVLSVGWSLLSFFHDFIKLLPLSVYRKLACIYVCYETEKRSRYVCGILKLHTDVVWDVILSFFLIIRTFNERTESHLTKLANTTDCQLTELPKGSAIVHILILSLHLCSFTMYSLTPRRYNPCRVLADSSNWVFVTSIFYRGRSSARRPTPNLEDQSASLSLRPVRQGRPYQ
jgi:hypothetical protein